jgi:hypothetical protein
MNECSDPVLASWSAFSFPAIPSWPCTHISWTLLCLANFMRDWWQGSGVTNNYRKIYNFQHVAFHLK